MTKLNAWLRPNHLTEDKSDFVAVPQTLDSLTISDLVKELQKEGMEIKAETAIDIITRFNRKTAEKVVQGYTINTGLVYISIFFSISFFTSFLTNFCSFFLILSNKNQRIKLSIC